MKCAELVTFAEDAAAIVESGWCAGQAEDQNGRVCAYGAVTKAVFGAQYGYRFHNRFLGLDEALFWHLFNCRRELMLVADDLLNEDGWYAGLDTWNDQVGRRASEVADLWRKVAKEIANNLAEYP